MGPFWNTAMKEGERNVSEEPPVCPGWADIGCIWDYILGYSLTIAPGNFKKARKWEEKNQVWYETDHKMAFGMEQRRAFLFQ